MAAHLLDLFSDESLDTLQSHPSDSLKEKYRYFDLSAIRPIPYPYAEVNQLSNPEIPFLTGGIRRLAFGLDQVYLTKHPLLRYGPGIHLHDPHCVMGARIADISACLLHYKFLGSFIDYTRQAVSEGNHWNDSYEYRQYDDTLKNSPHLNLKYPSATELRDSAQLIELGLLTLSRKHFDYIRSTGVPIKNAPAPTLPYDRKFYDEYTAGSLRSAEVILPVVRESLTYESVVDVGCGAGAWLATCARMGLTDLIGVDGDHVDSSVLLIPPEKFVAHDLTQRLDLGRRFDLVICLEVAEHLPEQAARTLVDNLTRLGDTILFSAAVPGQGGLGHINEQWPPYWQELFAEKSFRYFDVIRPRIGTNEAVEPWYRKNTFLVRRAG